MPKRMLWLSATIAASVLLAGCSPETAATGPEGLAIELGAQDNGAAPCRIERLARVDQALHSLYMVRGEGRYKLVDGRTRQIPVQIQFRGVEGVVSDDAMTLTDFEVGCDQVAIEWTIEYCQDHNRKKGPCPPFEVTGDSAFRSFSLSFE
ncbi:MAG: hypothetical protein AAGE01_19445 [Pseudomonadota bacterium]